MNIFSRESAWFAKRMTVAVLWPKWRLAAFFFVVLLSAGCGQPIFVGLPNAHTLAVDSAPPIVVTDQVPALDIQSPSLNPLTTLNIGPRQQVPNPQLATVSGPPFIWSDTDNYLVLGTDRRSGSGNWRTDTIIVVGLDRPNRRAAVLSIPRDLYVEIPNYGMGRINQVDYIGERIMPVEGGGPALVSQVLSETLGLQTGSWVRFEMTGFKSVVDAVGGVNVNLDCPFYEPIFNLDTNAWTYFTLPAGENHLDGEAAYWFVRLRLRESDIGRGKRQRQFLWALREQAMQTNLILRFPELWSAFRDSFTTDMSLLRMVELAQFGLGLDASNVRAGGITLRELESFRTEQGASVLRIADPERVRAVIEGIWTAPAMVDAYRQDATTCPAIPEGTPFIPEQAQAPNPDQTGDGAGPEEGALPPQTEPPAGIEAADAGNPPPEDGG